MRSNKTGRSKTQEVEPAGIKYTMDKTFELLVCAAIWSSPGAWRSVGRLLRPEAMPSDEGRILVRLAKLSAGDSGNSTGGVMIAYQIAETLAGESDKDAPKFLRTLGALENAYGMIEAGEIEVESVVNNTISELRRYEKDRAAGAILDRWSKKLDTADAIGEFAAAEAIGTTGDLGTQVLSSADRRRVIREAKTFDVLPTGIAALDAALGGGAARGNVHLIAGGPGDGKSSALTQKHSFCAGALRRVSALASCELKERQNILKFEASLWGIPINTLKENPRLLDQRYEEEGHKVAEFFFRHWDLPRGRPTIRSVFDWVDACEQESQKKVELLGIDHFDRFDPSNFSSKTSDYAKGEFVYDEIATQASDRGMFVWVPSHCVRKKTGPLWGPGDMANSSHKERRADAVYSVTSGGKPGGGRTVTLWLYKNREGEANVVIGPEPAGFAYGSAIQVDILTKVSSEYEGLV